MRSPKQRQLLSEALLVAEGKSLLAPTVEHLKALLAVGAGCREFTREIAYVQRYPEYTSANNILVLTNGLSHEELSTVTA